MHHVLRRSILAGSLCGGLLLLAACGLSSGQAGNAQPEAGTATVVHGTPGIVYGTPGGFGTATITPTTSSGSVPTGPVQLVLDKTSYAPGDIALVKIENGLSVPIAVSDHHSSCTYLVLEQLLGDWQPVDLCRLMTPTRLVDLPAGSVTPQKVFIPTGLGAAGTYRFELAYFPSAGATAGQSGPVYSATFTVS